MITHKDLLRAFSLGALVAAIISMGLAICFPRVVTKTEIKEVTKTKTRIVHIKNKDGSERTETDIEEEAKKKSELVSKLAAKQWLVSAGAGYSIETKQPAYTVQLQKRWIGPIFLGGKVDFSDKIDSGMVILTLEL